MELHRPKTGVEADFERVAARISAIGRCADSEIRGLALASELGSVVNNPSFSANVNSSLDDNPRLKLVSDLFALALKDDTVASSLVENLRAKDEKFRPDFGPREVAQLLLEVGDTKENGHNSSGRLEMSFWLIQRFFDAKPTRVDIENLMKRLPADLQELAQPTVLAWEQASDVVDSVKMEKIIQEYSDEGATSEHTHRDTSGRFSKPEHGGDFSGERYPRSTRDLLQDLKVHKLSHNSNPKYFEQLTGRDSLSAITTLLAVYERHLDYPSSLHPAAVPEVIASDVEQILSSLYDTYRDPYKGQDLYFDTGFRRLMEFKRRQISAASSSAEFDQRYQKYLDSLPPGFREAEPDPDELRRDFERHFLRIRGLRYAQEVLDKHGFDRSLAIVSGFDSVEFKTSGAYVEFGSLAELHKSLSRLLNSDPELAGTEVDENSMATLDMINSISVQEQDDSFVLEEYAWEVFFAGSPEEVQKNRISVERHDGKYRVKIDGQNSYVFLADLARDNQRAIHYDDVVQIVYGPHLPDVDRLIQEINDKPESERDIAPSNETISQKTEVSLPGFELTEMYRSVASIFLGQQLSMENFGALVLGNGGARDETGDLSVTKRGINSIQEAVGRAFSLVDVFFDSDSEGVISRIELDAPEIIFTLRPASVATAEVVAALEAIRHYSKLDELPHRNYFEHDGSRIRYDLSARRSQ